MVGSNCGCESSTGNRRDSIGAANRRGGLDAEVLGLNLSGYQSMVGTEHWFVAKLSSRDTPRRAVSRVLSRPCLSQQHSIHMARTSWLRGLGVDVTRKSSLRGLLHVWIPIGPASMVTNARPNSANLNADFASTST